MVEFLLSEKAKVDETDNFKWTALHHTVLTGNSEIVKMLINNGANVNAQSTSCTTPIMIAVLSNDLKMAEILVSRGAKVFDIVKKSKETMKSLTEAFTDEPLRIFMAALEKNKNKKKARFKALKISPKKQPRRLKESRKEIDNKLKPVVVERKIYRNNEKKVEKLILLNEKNGYATKPPGGSSYANDDSLFKQMQIDRDIYGWEYDFANFKTPLQRNVQRLLLLTEDKAISTQTKK
jgi:ankyrin repeat protein